MTRTRAGSHRLAVWVWQGDWQLDARHAAASYLTPSLTYDMEVAGAGAVRLWLPSSTAEVDLRATISEVSDDGTQTFVQTSYLRASMRTPCCDGNARVSTPTGLSEPQSLLDDAGAEPAGRGEPSVQLTIPLCDSGYRYRAGSRIQVTIQAHPAGSRRHPAQPVRAVPIRPRLGVKRWLLTALRRHRQPRSDSAASRR